MASIDILAASIADHVSKLSSLLREADLPSPTFNESSFGDFAHEDNTPMGKSLRETRSCIIDAAQDLIRLVQGPTEQILALTWAAADTANIDLITRLKIPQHVPLGSSISIQELAAAVRIPESVLARTVRYAIANGIFEEEESGVIRHSASSAALVRNPGLAKIVHFGTQCSGTVMTKLPDVILQKRDNPADAKHTAFNIAYGTDEPVFEYLHRNQDLNRKYHEYMVGRTAAPLWSVDRLHAAWPWSSLGKVKVVDIGGSSGHTALALAPVMPEATFVVQDNNLSALEMGRRAVAGDSSLESRVSFAEYDFFKPQPIQADIYIYRHILHDWNDEDCVKILSSLLPALKPGARVLISDAIIPDPPAKRLNTFARKMVRTEDMIMLAVHDSCERTVGDFKSLFQKVSVGNFRLVGVTSGVEAGAFQSLLEFEFLGLRN